MSEKGSVPRDDIDGIINGWSEKGKGGADAMTRVFENGDRSP